MEPDGSEPEGKRILCVWRLDDHQLHIDSITGEWDDPAEWGRALADIARHLAECGAASTFVDLGVGERTLTVDEYLERLADGWNDGVARPCKHRRLGP